MIKVGDKVTRMLCGEIPIELRVTALTKEIIECGLWKFDRKTGFEIDEDLGWGPEEGESGSYLKEIIRK